MNDGTMKADEDDWETADLSDIKAPAGKGKAGKLRPSAPQFTPRSASSSPTKPENAALPAAQGRPPVTAPPVRLMTRSNAGASGSGSAGAGRAGNKGTRDNGDDDWFGSRGKVTNRQIWESANASTAAPSVILAPTAQPLPQPSIQILRRDQAQQGSTSKQSETQAPQKTLEEREEQYRLARERIFGATPSVAPAAATTPSGAQTSTSSSQIPSASSSSANGTASSSRSSSKQGRKRSAKTAAPGLQLQQQQLPQQYMQQPMYGDSDPYAPSMMLGPTPQQIRTSPMPAPLPGTLRTAPPQGIVRQPRGPEAGGGFGQSGASNRSATPGGAEYGAYWHPPTSYAVQPEQQYHAFDGRAVDDEMAHWMSQASFGSVPRAPQGRY